MTPGRLRPGRRRRRARLAGAAVLAGLVAATGSMGLWLWRSGAVDAERVVVSGARLTGEQTVREQLRDVVGTPLTSIDTRAAAETVERLPLVVSADVGRRWPDTVTVTVTERRPVAAVRHGEQGYVLVDDEAVTVERVSSPPGDLPVVTVDVAAGPEPLRAALAVADSLPPDLAAATTSVSASSAADVRLVVDDREVRWGTARESARKAEVLRELFRRVDAGVYDVSAPGAPATSP